MKKRIIILFLASLFFISFASSQVSYCCEKTEAGAWCQNVNDRNLCNQSFHIAPTSCESTSYCRQGCCYNNNEGTCTRNTPEKVCNNGGGVWSSDANCNIPQCDLGCCLIGDQAAFVTATRCKRLSTLYGLPISFRKNIGSELQCIASVRTKVMGACVFEDEFFDKTCIMETQSECMDRQATGVETEFFEGLLCTNPRLETNCAPSTRTTCVPGKDQVYFLDTCNNLANVYWYDKRNDTAYWSEIKTPAESCNPNINNAGSKTCGNCNYFGGSTCQRADRGEVNLGDYVCKNLGCEDVNNPHVQDFRARNNRFPKHGETWCASSPGTSKIFFGEVLTESNIKKILTEENLPGSRYFRLICYNGEVIIEPCADYRQEICVEVDGDFRYAACKANRWKECFYQDNEKDCENRDKMDCVWMDFRFEEDRCIPLYSPGFSSLDENTCSSLGTTHCIARYERKKFLPGSSDWEAEDGEHCDKDESRHKTWIDEMNTICWSIGDCGMHINYLNQTGFYDEEDILIYSGRLRSGERAKSYIEGLE